MAVSIHIRFLTGRAHLHAWQAHPSEGQVEWPPSPWRLLRALVAVGGRGLTTLPQSDAASFAPDWFTPKLSRGRKSKPVDSFWSTHVDLIPLDELGRMLHTLACKPPIVWLPRTAIGHTRHFFPTTAGKSTGSAVFDTFAAFDSEQPLVFEWPELTADKLPHLERLLARMLYFGRAESWCEASLQAAGFSSNATHWPCVAVEGDVLFARYFQDQPEHRDYTIARRLGWDASQMEFLIQQFPKAENVSSAEFLLRCLLRSSGESARDGDRPWGTRWLHYAVSKEIFRLRAMRTMKRIDVTVRTNLLPQPDFQVIRYRLNTPTVHRAVLPPVPATLPIAQRCRAAVMSIFGKQNSRLCSPQLTGRRLPDDPYDLFSDAHSAIKFDEKNGGHGAHAYYWPMDEDSDGFLDHLIIYCHAGFSAVDMAALRSLTRVTQTGNRSDLLLTPIFEGRLDGCAGNKRGISQSLATTKCFVSATPYFCPLHLTGGKSGGRNRPKLSQIVSASISKVPGLSNARIESLEEIVFDYDPASLSDNGAESPNTRQLLVRHLQRDLQDASGNVIAPAGAAVCMTLAAPLPKFDEHLPSTRYPRACVRHPDDKAPLGFSRGLFASQPARFIPALAFARTRSAESKLTGAGRVLRVVFREIQPSHPFAVGRMSHFGLGLFVPADSHEAGQL